MAKATKIIAFKVDPDTQNLMHRMIAEDGLGERAQSVWLRQMIRKEAARRYVEIVSTTELPHPDDANPVPLVVIRGA